MCILCGPGLAYVQHGAVFSSPAPMLFAAILLGAFAVAGYRIGLFQLVKARFL